LCLKRKKGREKGKKKGGKEKRPALIFKALTIPHVAPEKIGEEEEQEKERGNALIFYL